MGPGGLAFDRGMLITGFGGSMPGGLIGNLVGLADLLLIDPSTSEGRAWATGLERRT